MKFKQVHLHEIEDFWELAIPYINKSIVRGAERTIDTVYREITEDDSMLWVVIDDNNKVHGAAVTTCVNFPLKRVLMLKYLASDRGVMENHSEGFMETFKEHARVTDCKTIEIRGRRGWGRALLKYGFKLKHYTYEAIVYED